MKGDFSRGTSPDGKRGRHYRRVLLQQGRVLLDSDHAAAVDALQREDRDTLRHVACAHGSSDSGFLCTPGRLLALFETTEGVEVVSGTPRTFIDYRHRYLSRQPALCVEASGGAAAVVRLQLRTTAARLAVWARAEANTTLTIGGVSAPLTGTSPPEAFERALFVLGAATDLVQVTIPAGATVWIALIESDVDAGAVPLFHAASGSYQLDGLPVHLRQDAGFPETAFPTAAGFWPTGSPPAGAPLGGLIPGNLTAGVRLVAYVEAWERHLTAVEDPGILERALGGNDSCTRTEALGQLKLARVTFATTGPTVPDIVRAAFRSVQVSDGRLSISHRQASSTTDPCALPELEGYTGTDNRLYRFEVHEGGPLADVRLKWSRDNGSELFEAEVDSTNRLLVPKDVPLADNDLVEVLSEVIDLGDSVLAQVSATAFVPPTRATGTLARLVEVETVSSNHRVFELADPLDTSAAISLATVLPRLGDLDLSRLRLRRWDGIVDPGASAGSGSVSAGPHDVENGLQLTFSNTGTYEPGQFWQYEARAGDVNADSEVQAALPHGPERLFAPLALFRFQAATDPLELQAWLDTRYPRLCSITGDDVAFDGTRVESESSTVQEALEELFDRGPEIIQSGCGELTVRPENSLQAIFDTIPSDGDAKVCIHPGQWTLTAPVLVQGKGNLVVTGAGRGTRITAANLDALLVFQNCRSVSIEGLSLRGGAQAGGGGAGLEGVVSFLECGSVDVRDLRVVCGAAPTRRVSAIRVFSQAMADTNAIVRVRDCDVEVGHGQTGILVVNAQSVDVRGNTLRTPAQPLNWPQLVTDPSVSAWIGRLLIDNVIMGETAEANDELLVGSPDVVVNAQPGIDGRPRIIAHLEQWGYEFITFTTHPALGPAFWEPLLVANPIPGFSAETVTLDWVHANLRRLRTRLARWMYAGASGAQVNVPTGPVRTTLMNLTPTLVNFGSLTTGGQGIVVGGRRAPTFGLVETGTNVPGPLREPDVRISDNRVEGFVQGIHLGSSYNQRSSDRGRWLRLYRAHVQRNTVFLRIPPIARERHGIFVGNAQNVQVVDNLVELEAPHAANAFSAPPTDGIRVWGAAGPMLQIAGNHTVGVTTGVRVFTPTLGLPSGPGVVRSIQNNAYGGIGIPQVVTP